MSSGTSPKHSFTFELPKELSEKLAVRVSGASLTDYIVCLVLADLERAQGASSELSKSIETAGRFMDRYRDAYKELAGG